MLKVLRSNLDKKLRSPFAPISPIYGPIFPRSQRWVQDFLSEVSGGCYRLYYGPTELGKSVGIHHSLENRLGVTHLSLRECGPDELGVALSNATKIFGQNVPGIVFLV